MLFVMDPAPGAHVSWPHLAVRWLTRRVLCMNLPVGHAGMTLSSRRPGALPGSPLLSGENPHPQSPSSWLLYPCGFLRGLHASSPTKLPLLQPAELSQHQCLEPFPSFPKSFGLPPQPMASGWSLLWAAPCLVQRSGPECVPARGSHLPVSVPPRGQFSGYREGLCVICLHAPPVPVHEAGAQVRAAE